MAYGLELRYLLLLFYYRSQTRLLYCQLVIFAPCSRSQMSPTGEHVNDVSDVLTVGQVVDVRIREVRRVLFFFASLSTIFRCTVTYSFA